MREQQVVGIPLVEIKSFICTGIPVSGVDRLSAMTRSARSAWLRARSWVMVTKDFTRFSTCRIRSRQEAVKSTELNSRATRPRWAS